MPPMKSKCIMNYCHNWPDTEVGWKRLKQVLSFSSCQVTMNEPKWSQYLLGKKKKYISWKAIRRQRWTYGQVYVRMELCSHSLHPKLSVYNLAHNLFIMAWYHWALNLHAARASCQLSEVFGDPSRFYEEGKLIQEAGIEPATSAV